VEGIVGQVDQTARRAGCQLGDAAIALGATALAFIFLVLSAIASQDSDTAPSTEGTLVAAFITRNEIVLCSDGRVVSSADGAVVRDDWSKVHRLSDRIGVLTAGRDLPGLMTRVKSQLSRRPAVTMADTVATLRQSLVEEWANVTSGSRSAGRGRTFVFVAGFDESGKPRLFHLDSQTQPEFTLSEMPLFETVRDLEIGAIATGTQTEDPSAVIVRHLGGLQRRQPTLGLHQLLLGAFNETKTQLAASNSRIGGLTYAAAIDRTNGFRDVTAR
jgi:proteasome subunit B (beta)-like protein